jgi:hypothetical protein
MDWDWILTPHIHYGNVYRKTPDHRKVDEIIKLCPECKTCWEMIYNGHKHYPQWLEDFPTIGKKRETCPKCEETTLKKGT